MCLLCHDRPRTHATHTHIRGSLVSSPRFSLSGRERQEHNAEKEREKTFKPGIYDANFRDFEFREDDTSIHRGSCPLIAAKRASSVNSSVFLIVDRRTKVCHYIDPAGLDSGNERKTQAFEIYLARSKFQSNAFRTRLTLISQRS